MKQLVFPCGARYDLRQNVTFPLAGPHVAKDGSVRLAVAGTGWTPPRLPDGSRASCLSGCLKPGRHAKQQRVFLGIGGAKLGWLATCHGRLYEDGVDVTPPQAGACQHCREGRAYVAACRRAARKGKPIPDRMQFRAPSSH